jgi:hemerythrin-like domain-containing protein
VQPTKELKEEHNGIKVMLLVLENISGRLETGKSVDAGHLDMIADFVQIYVDKCHHGKEELMLFPALEQAGVAKESGIIGELLAEHTSGRCHVQQFIKDNNSYK